MLYKSTSFTFLPLGWGTSREWGGGNITEMGGSGTIYFTPSLPSLTCTCQTCPTCSRLLPRYSHFFSQIYEKTCLPTCKGNTEQYRQVCVCVCGRVCSSFWQYYVAHMRQVIHCRVCCNLHKFCGETTATAIFSSHTAVLVIKQKLSM